MVEQPAVVEKNKGGRPRVNPEIKYSPELGEVAIRAYGQFGVLVAAGQACGVHRTTIANWMEQYVRFGEAMRKAKDQYVETLELLLDQRIKGTGKMADTLLMFKLKREVPAYRESSVFNNNNIGNINIISAVPRPGQKLPDPKTVDITPIAEKTETKKISAAKPVEAVVVEEPLKAPVLTKKTRKAMGKLAI